MLREIRKIESHRFHVPTIEDINPYGTMAVVWGKTENTCYGRGLLNKEGRSCVFEGTIEFTGLRATVIPQRVLISPELRPRTEEGKEVYGYEDPTFMPNYDLFPSLSITEAYYKNEDRTGGLGTNLLRYNLVTGKVTTFFTPTQLLEQGLQSHYRTADMVKECQIGDDGREYVELGCDGKSRIVCGKQGGSLRRTTFHPCIDPDRHPGTWLAEHASTAGNPIWLDDNTKLLVFNGRADNMWQIGWALFDRYDRLTIGMPFITPPKRRKPGPGGQHIAFGSDVKMIGPDEIGVLWHHQDKYPYYTRAKLIRA